ncbi:MAG: hypothetical protein QOF61_869 [Acidobacteriota bacterium]|jgi:hypothetical protein|nr:hypothetical protein [Acidobacteriota bacterium]
MQIRKRVNLRSLIFLLLTLVAAAGLFGALPSVAGAVGQTSNEAKSRTPVHHRKQVHVSCRQICLADYDACASPGAKRGVRSCKAVRNECLAACPTAP